MVLGGFAGVLRYLLLVFSVVFLLQFWKVIHANREVCIETRQ